MGRPHLPLCPHCGARMKSGPSLIVRVHNYLLGRVNEDAVIRTTSHEIAQRIDADRSSVAGALRRLEAEGTIKWQRGDPGGHRGRIQLL